MSYTSRLNDFNYTSLGFLFQPGCVGRKLFCSSCWVHCVSSLEKVLAYDQSIYGRNDFGLMVCGQWAFSLPGGPGGLVLLGGKEDRDPGPKCPFLFYLSKGSSWPRVLTQCLLHCKEILCHLSHQGSRVISVYLHKYCTCMLSCIWLFEAQWTVVLRCPLSMGFSRQEYWTGLPFPPPGDLPDPEIKTGSQESPALLWRFFTTEPPGKPYLHKC